MEEHEMKCEKYSIYSSIQDNYLNRTYLLLHFSKKITFWGLKADLNERWAREEKRWINYVRLFIKMIWGPTLTDCCKKIVLLYL